MRARDTSPEAARRQAEVLAGMTGAERVAVAVEMAEEAKAIAIAGIRARRPGLSPDEVAREWLRMLYGDEVARLES